jgi:hypothetical protein
MYAPHDVAIWLVIECVTNTQREIQAFLRMITVKPTLAYATGIASPIATRDAGGPKK